MQDISVDGILMLKTESDRIYFLDKVNHLGDLHVSCEEINQAILFLSDYVSDEWLTIYNGLFVSVNIGPKQSHSFNFFSGIVPLGLNLIQLKDLDKFHRLIEKLEVPSHERISTILEISTASKYRRAGYEIELEPSIGNNKFSDCRVKFQGEWIYFECKVENLHESKYYKKKIQYVGELVDEILGKGQKYLDSTHRIDITLNKQLQVTEREKFINEILCTLQNKEVERSKEINGVHFAINSRKVEITPPAMHIRLGRITVGTTPTQISQENTYIQVIFNPFGNKEIQKLRRIVKEAKNQIPKNSRGVIIVKSEHSKPVVDIAKEKLMQPDYKNIAAILVIGRDLTWVVPNNKHSDIPLEFLQMAVQ